MGVFCKGDNPQPLLSSTNQVRTSLFVEANAYFPLLSVSYAVTSPGRHPKMAISVTSPSSGYVTSPGYDGVARYAPYVNSFHRLSVPGGHAVMVSFPRFHLQRPGAGGCYDYLRVYVLPGGGGDSRVLRDTHCGQRAVPPSVYGSSLSLHFHSDYKTQRLGFKLLFSFHPRDAAPQRAPRSGLLACDTPAFAAFRDHVACNYVTECQRGEDEAPGQCPRSSDACRGAVRYGSTCYMYFSRRWLSWDEAAEECRRRNASLAGFKTAAELAAFREMVGRGKGTAPVLVGLQRVHREPLAFYGRLWRWTDTTVSYVARPPWTRRRGTALRKECALFAPRELHVLSYTRCDHPVSADYVCQFQAPGKAGSTPERVVLPALRKREKRQCRTSRSAPLARCPGGHFTHDFLSCGDCGGGLLRSTPACSTRSVSVPSFACENTGHIPYTLVCDLHADCADGSDESFCRHRDCGDDLTCDNGQCLAASRKCDGRQDCRDASDELYCKLGVPSESVLFNPPPPAVIEFDAEGDFSGRSLGPLNQCPETHFLCPDSHCLPVYVVCNEVYDCPGWEDEVQCDSYTCPGFYRCRLSAVCLHPDHLCDGVFQCPLQDDELLCDVSCPPGCGCQGLSAVCPQPFPAHLYGQLRYVDASGSMMTPDAFNGNVYLVGLRLSRCGVKQLVNVTLPNLQILDLSYNNFTTLKTDWLPRLQNLRQLTLSGNPLVDVKKPNTNNLRSSLQLVDFSLTRFRVLDLTLLDMFTDLKHLNVSHSGLLDIHGHCRDSSLEVIDLHAAPIAVIGAGVFKSLTKLKVVHGESYKLCCRGN